MTADCRSLDKLVNRLCLWKHTVIHTNIHLLYTGKATSLRSLCQPILCPWNICQFKPICGS